MKPFKIQLDEYFSTARHNEWLAKDTTHHITGVSMIGRSRRSGGNGIRCLGLFLGGWIVALVLVLALPSVPTCLHRVISAFLSIEIHPRLLPVGIETGARVFKCLDNNANNR
jgi:hypothetical protein